MSAPVGARLAGRLSRRSGLPALANIARHSRAPTVIIAAALLAGCASAPREVVRRVEVPVREPCPALHLPPRPHMPRPPDLPPDATVEEIAAATVRATAASLEALTGYAAALETLLGPSE